MSAEGEKTPPSGPADVSEIPDAATANPAPAMATVQGTANDPGVQITDEQLADNVIKPTDSPATVELKNLKKQWLRERRGWAESQKANKRQKIMGGPGEQSPANVARRPSKAGVAAGMAASPPRKDYATRYRDRNKNAEKDYAKLRQICLNHAARSMVDPDIDYRLFPDKIRNDMAIKLQSTNLKPDDLAEVCNGVAKYIGKVSIASGFKDLAKTDLPQAYKVDGSIIQTYEQAIALVTAEMYYVAQECPQPCMKAAGPSVWSAKNDSYYESRFPCGHGNSLMSWCFYGPDADNGKIQNLPKLGEVDRYVVRPLVEFLQVALKRGKGWTVDEFYKKKAINYVQHIKNKAKNTASEGGPMYSCERLVQMSMEINPTDPVQGLISKTDIIRSCAKGPNVNWLLLMAHFTQGCSEQQQQRED